jgi:hypothetical protein
LKSNNGLKSLSAFDDERLGVPALWSGTVETLTNRSAPWLRTGDAAPRRAFAAAPAGIQSMISNVISITRSGVIEVTIIFNQRGNGGLDGADNTVFIANHYVAIMIASS